MEQKSISISSETIVRAITIGIFFAGLYFLRNIVVLVLVSIVLASFVEAGVLYFKKYDISRTLSVPLIYSVGLVGIFLLIYAFVPIIFRELSSVTGLLLEYIGGDSAQDSQVLQNASNLVSELSTEEGSIGEILARIQSVASSVSSGFTSIVSSTFSGVANAVLVIVMSFYLAIQEKGIDQFLKIVTPRKHELYVLDLWTRTQQKIGLWFQGQMLLGLIMGMIVFIGLAIMGVQNALLIAITSAIFELVPFGLAFAAIPAVLFAILNGGFVLGFKVLIFFIVIQQLENYLFQPMIVKRAVGIPPLIVLLSLLIGIALAGFWGAILALPVAVLILEYISDMEKNKEIVTVTHRE
jgi:predicted PurR-regulated permease PerM